MVVAPMLLLCPRMFMGLLVSQRQPSTLQHGRDWVNSCIPVNLYFPTGQLLSCCGSQGHAPVAAGVGWLLMPMPGLQMATMCWTTPAGGRYICFGGCRT